MGKLNGFIVGITMGILITACSAVPKFTYKYYALDAQDYGGSLRGPKPSDDLSLEECRPTEKDKAPCVVMKTATFMKLKKEYLENKGDLINCQRGNCGR